VNGGGFATSGGWFYNRNMTARLFSALLLAGTLAAQRPFTLEQVTSAPFPSNPEKK